MEAQRVVVIQDASREVNSSAIRWILHGLSLKPGDMLTLLIVLHQVNTPSTLSFVGAWTMGNISRVDSSSMLSVDQRNVDREAAKKKEEYDNNVELAQISKLYDTHKVEFKIKVAAGPSPKVVALKAAQDMKATWVILDRQMKKDRRYFLEKLSCGISRMKRNNSIEQLRGPKSGKTNNMLMNEEDRKSQVLYDEMVPGIPEEGDLFSIEIISTKDDKVSEAQEIKRTSEDDEVNQVLELKQASIIEEIEELWEGKDVYQNLMCTICKNRRPASGWEREFTVAEIEAATNDFSPKNSLSEGGGGFAFRGQLKNNLKIVVKHYNVTNPQADVNFSSVLRLLKKARHPNLVMLLGSCIEGSLRLLVYEYACNGSVNQHLSKSCPLPLTWIERMRVALGSARGLNYLHENNIIHRSMRTSNILLTHDFEPLIADYGLQGLKTDQSSEPEVLDSMWYLAPEYAETRKLSSRTDVYVFGIILLELITGRMPTDKLPGGKSLLEWARPLLKERRHQELLDPRIVGTYDDQQFYWMCRVTQKCLSKDPKKRLDMDKVVSALECIAERKTCEIIEDISAMKSFLARRISGRIGLPSHERASARESFSIEVDIENQKGRSSSFSSTTFSRTSFSRSAASSRQGEKLWRAKSRKRTPLLYSEMLN